MSIGTVNANSPIPLYHQVKQLVLTAIETGHWSNEQQLPNESKLAELFGVSKITIRQALQELAGLGYVRRRQGRGTFISEPKFGQGPRELMSFTEEMGHHGVAASARVLEKRVAVPEMVVAQKLHLPPTQPVLFLKRLRFANGVPVGIQSAHIPLGLAAGLENENFENASLYGILQSRYGLDATRAHEQYFAVSAEKMDAELLEIAEGAAVFAAERVTFHKDAMPFEFTRSIMRGDRYSIVLKLVRG